MEEIECELVQDENHTYAGIALQEQQVESTSALNLSGHRHVSQIMLARGHDP